MINHSPFIFDFDVHPVIQAGNIVVELILDVNKIITQLI
jgi:hypothetical protein